MVNLTRIILIVRKFTSETGRKHQQKYEIDPRPRQHTCSMNAGVQL